MEPMGRIRRGGRLMKGLVTLLMAALPAAMVLFWVFVNQVDPTMRNLPVIWQGNLPAESRVLGLLASAPPMAVVFYALVVLRRLFTLYAQGSVFRAENVACFRRLGWVIVAWVAAEFLCTPLMSVTLTWHLGQGNRLGIIQLGSDHIITLFAGLAVLTISWVMDEGRKISEEQELFV